jgi:hypothetical protein
MKRLRGIKPNARSVLATETVTRLIRSLRFLFIRIGRECVLRASSNVTGMSKNCDTSREKHTSRHAIVGVHAWNPAAISLHESSALHTGLCRMASILLTVSRLVRSNKKRFHEPVLREIL